VFKKFLNKRYEKRKLEAETTCQRAYERLQEVGIEVFKVDIKYVHVSSWQPTFVITIDATGNVHQYQLSKTIDDNKDNTWKFTEGHRTVSQTAHNYVSVSQTVVKRIQLRRIRQVVLSHRACERVLKKGT
jgi:hypothetical protein